MNRFFGACLLLVGACGSNGTTWIGAEVDQSLVNPDVDAGTEASAVCTPVGPGDACTSRPPRLLPALVVQGNQILQNGRPFHLYAVARGDLLWGEDNLVGCNGEDHFHDADLDLMTSWNMNTVRIGLSQARWFGRKCDGATYAARVDHAVEMANAHGLYVILELHWTDAGGMAPCDSSCGIGLQPMPDAENIELWRQVAARYGKNPGVVFDIFNEPGLADWSCWRNGGCAVDAGTVSGVSYVAVGMQQLFDAARSSAPSSLVIVAGADGAEDLSGITSGYAITGTQIVYGAHVYRRLGNPESDWLGRFGSLSATYPIMVTEMGPLDCNGDQSSRLMTYLDLPLADSAVRISWGVRSWNQPGSCGYPSVIADWNGTPLGAHGLAVRDHLQSYGTAAGAVP